MRLSNYWLRGSAVVTAYLPSTAAFFNLARSQVTVAIYATGYAFVKQKTYTTYCLS